MSDDESDQFVPAGEQPDPRREPPTVVSDVNVTVVDASPESLLSDDQRDRVIALRVARDALAQRKTGFASRDANLDSRFSLNDLINLAEWVLDGGRVLEGGPDPEHLCPVCNHLRWQHSENGCVEDNCECLNWFGVAATT